jgi:hypothetical protein
MPKKNTKKEIGEIVTAMTQLEIEMARQSYPNGASQSQVAEWVLKSTKLSSRLDKVWKSLK